MGPRRTERIVIVGASLAGLRAAETLRGEGHEGEIVMIGAEPHRPYDRPPLSKKLLAGEWEPDRIALRRPDALEGLDLDWRLGTRAGGLDLARRVVVTDDDLVAFDALILACGATPRWLPGVGPSEPDAHPLVTALRTLDDSLALRRRLAAGDHRVVVVGAGFIGLEVAATARRLGNEVTVLEAASAPLVRALGEPMGAAVAAIHADAGVEVRCGVSVEGVDGAGVHLGGGEVVAADVVVIGIGVAPATGWLDGSGVELRDGVVCDATLAVSGGHGVDTRAVRAAGDVARWPNPLFGEEMRVEHWTNAAEQGNVAARNLLAEMAGDEPEEYAPVPFFWSDQYDHRVQFLGRAGPDDEVRVVSGSVAERRFLALFGRGDRLRGALGLNVPRLVMPFRNQLADRVSFVAALESIG